MILIDELNLTENINDHFANSIKLTDDLTVNLSETVSTNRVNELTLSDNITIDLTDLFIRTIKIIDEFCRPGKQYTYSEILDKFRDLTTVVDNFLPDWYTLRYIQKESILDRASVARVAIALSNLLRLAVENDIDEIHFVSLRIRKLYVEEVNKDLFVITDY